MIRTLLAPFLIYPIASLEAYGPVYFTPIGTAEVWG